MKKTVFIFFLMLLMPVAAFAQNEAGNPSVIKEIHVTNDGKVVLRGVKVMQLAGDTFYCRLIWENVFIRLVVRSDKNTKFIKLHGGDTGVSEVNVGDYIDVEGTLPLSSESFIVLAKTVRNTSLLKENRVYKGTVTSVNQSTGTFALKTEGKSVVTVNVSEATLIKGKRTITPSEVAIGDRILSVSGTLDYNTSVLAATRVEIYQDKSVFKARNFEGVLSALSGAVLPVTFTFMSEGKTFTVYLQSGSIIMNRDKKKIELSRVVANDRVRVNGSIRETNLNEIDATVLRDISF